MIGVCTAVIGDVAGHLGCFIFLKDSVNAIAFVALGTSVPGWSRQECRRDTMICCIALLSIDNFFSKTQHITCYFFPQSKPGLLNPARAAIGCSTILNAV